MIKVFLFISGLGLALAIGVAVLHTCCRDQIVTAIPELDGRK